jgi:predicted PurR-regulated permease PerM
MRRVFRNAWVRLALAALAVVLLVRALGAVAGVLTPFAVAFGLAYFLNPAANALERLFARAGRRLRLFRVVEPRAAAVGLLAVLAALVVALALVILVPAVAGQVKETVVKLPEYAQRLRAKLEPLYERLNLEYPEQTEEARRRLEEALKTNLPQVLRPVTQAIEAAFSSVMSFILTLLNLMVIPVFVLYLLFDMNRIQHGAAELVPYRNRPYVYSRLAEVDRLLAAFVRGQVTVCLILGAFYALGLTTLGVPLGLLVGFVIGFFNLVPFMSYVLGLPLALLLSWVDDQSPQKLAAVAVVFTVGQFVEGNFITPRIVGESIGLHSLIIMLAVLVGGTLLGFIGMLIAVPTTASLSVFWKDLRDAYLRSEFYRGGQPPPASSLPVEGSGS